MDASSCFTCGGLNTYLKYAAGYVDKLSEALQSPMEEIFISLCGLWAATVGIRVIVELSAKREYVKELIWILLGGSLLFQYPRIITSIYLTILNLLGAVGSVAFKVAAPGDFSPAGASPTGGLESLSLLMGSTEKAFAAVVNVAGQIATSGAWFDWVNYVVAGLLLIPYVGMVFLYFSQVVVATFRAVILATFGPFLMMSFAFGWGRGMAIAGLQTTLSTIMTLFASSAVVGLVIFGVTSLEIHEPSSSIFRALHGDVDLASPDLLIVILLGWLGPTLQLCATEISNSISKSMLNNAAAGTMTAGLMGTAALALMPGKVAGAWAAKKGLEGVGYATNKAGAPIGKGGEWLWGKTKEAYQSFAEQVKGTRPS